MLLDFVFFKRHLVAVCSYSSSEKWGGGSAAAVTATASRGHDPKKQWSYPSYYCNESLDHCIHLSTLTADGWRLLLLIVQIQHKTHNSQNVYCLWAKMPNKVVSRLKVADRTSKRKKAAAVWASTCPLTSLSVYFSPDHRLRWRCTDRNQSDEERVGESKNNKKSTFGWALNCLGEPAPSAPFWARSLCHFLSVVWML